MWNHAGGIKQLTFASFNAYHALIQEMHYGAPGCPQHVKLNEVKLDNSGNSEFTIVLFIQIRRCYQGVSDTIVHELWIKYSTHSNMKPKQINKPMCLPEVLDHLV